jgi:hypothetical protein
VVRLEWIKPDTLQTIAGATLAVTIVVAVLKALLPDIKGRLTQLFALIVSIVIAGLIGSWASFAGVMMIVLNGCLIFLSAMGLDQAITYKRNVKVKE